MIKTTAAQLRISLRATEKLVGPNSDSAAALRRILAKRLEQNKAARQLRQLRRAEPIDGIPLLAGAPWYKLGEIDFDGKSVLFGVGDLTAHDRDGQHCNGMAVHREGDKSSMFIDSHILADESLSLEVVIHEAIHIALPAASEPRVLQIGNLISSAVSLWLDSLLALRHLSEQRNPAD